ncbi:sugar ABC transporter substrate-binding protein [Streptomyces sp. NPDC019937]|uniref:ABC transporter substrate-binding protein n=1 Tax=Streptomyces sp. NPDC019937 TaxID=3154787 RepID=UPI0033C66C45
MKRLLLTRAATAAALAATLAISGCQGAGVRSSGGGKQTIHVLATKNPQMVTLKQYTKKYFTSRTGITVDYTLLPENQARNRMNREFARQDAKYDVASVSAYEVPTYSRNHWLAPLDSYEKADKSFDQKDIFPSLLRAVTGADGKIYAEPFYGEGSFLMYRKDLFRKSGLTMPRDPTWRQVASLAAKIDGTDGASGICLRGLPGWGQNLAPINTVVNTFGGSWYDMRWNARLTSPEFTKAIQFYVGLVRKYGEPDAARSGVLDILADFSQGKCAMMYDASSLATSIEADGSTVKGKVGYVPAPHELTRRAGWLWTWAWGVENASKKKDAAWKFISWASSKQYQAQIGNTLGWNEAPAGSRKSLYANPNYQKAAAAWYRQEYAAVKDSADPRNPGVGPRPYQGISFVGIPQFADLGNKVSAQISAAIAGEKSVRTALRISQKLAQDAVAHYRSR